MKIIESSFYFNEQPNGQDILKRLEKAGRICYKSEHKITPDSAKNFIAKIIERGHESVLEHEKITLTIICDRGVSHELVRHRIASYSQESTRYCNYSNQQFGGELTFIKPCFWDENEQQYVLWEKQMQQVEELYNELVDLGASPQEARAILPNSLKTEIVVTMNMREWRHFLKLRTSPAAHPQMKEIAQQILSSFKEELPVLFDDIDYVI